MEANIRYPVKFGTGNAKVVIEAIYNIEPTGDIEWFTKFLCSEQFCYVMKDKAGKIRNNILRIDLYRQLDERKDSNGWEFTGGIFHAL